MHGYIGSHAHGLCDGHILTKVKEQNITNITKGETYQAEPFPEFIQEIIRKGGLMASIKN